jgi:hypothetical protein
MFYDKSSHLAPISTSFTIYPPRNAKSFTEAEAKGTSRLPPSQNGFQFQLLYYKSLILKQSNRINIFTRSVHSEKSDLSGFPIFIGFQCGVYYLSNKI